MPRGAAAEGQMDEVRLTIRLPADVADFLTKQSRENFTSRNAEVIRSVKERISRLDKEKGEALAL